MTLIEQKMLDAYFENPPLTDYLSLPGPFTPGVLGSPIAERILHRKAATDMMTAAERDRDRLRRHTVRLATQDFDVDAAERRLDVIPGPKILIATELARPDKPAKRNAKPVRFTPREFRRKMDPVALGMTAAERADKIMLYRDAARMMWQGADWDESLKIAMPKVMDQLLYMTERLLFNIQTSLKETADQLNALMRQSMGDEIPRQQLERLEWKQAGLRVQERHYQLMEFAFKAEHLMAVHDYEAGTGRSWGAYEGIKKRAERSARAWRSKVRRRSSMSMVIENMSEEDYARWVDTTKRYEPKADGTAASDEEVLNIDTGLGYDAAEGSEWAGDDEWSGDGVHRQGHDGGFIEGE